MSVQERPVMPERPTLPPPPAMRAAMARRAVPPPEPKPAPPLPATPEPEPKPNFVGSSDKVKAARQPPRTDKGVRRHETNLRVHALLAERFPAAFSRPRPLAV